MNYPKAAYDKVTDLERYVNTLAKRISTQKSNTVVFFCDKETVGSSKAFEFSFEVSADTSIFLDLHLAVSGFSGTFAVLVSVNNAILMQKQFECSTATSARIALPFLASFGENQIEIALSSSSSNCKLDNMTFTLSGLNLLAKAISHVSGLKNSSGTWTFGEAKNNTINLVSQNLTSSVAIKTLDFSVQGFFMSKVSDTNFAFVISGGGLYSVLTNAEAQTKKLQSSVESATIGCINGQSTLFVVCRNRLFCRNIDSDMKNGTLVPTGLNSNEKVLKVCVASINQDTFVLCVQTTTKIHLYIASNAGFELLQTLTASGLCSCTFENGSIFVAISNFDVTRVLKVVLSTGIVEVGQNLGSFDSFFQLSGTEALVSKDNKLSLFNFS